MARAGRSGSKRRVSAFVVVLVLLVAGTGLWISLRFNGDVSAARAHAARGAVVVRTRCGPIEYAQAGHGVPLLMIHGSGGGHDQGMAFARALAQQGIQVIAPSRFGYLGTPLPADASPAAQADAHACLLDALGIGRAAVVGASAGALSALQMAIRHPGRVASLTLVVPITYRPTDTAGSVPASSAWAEKLLLSLIARQQQTRRSQTMKPATPCEAAGLAKTPDAVLAFSDRSEACLRPSRLPEGCRDKPVAKLLTWAFTFRIGTLCVNAIAR